MKTCGEALEYLLHCHFHPPINYHIRTIGGSYRERPPENSKSKAAISSASFSHLFKVVLGAWSDLETIAGPAPDDGRIADYSSYGRVIFPSALLASSNSARRNTFPKETGCHLQTPDVDHQISSQTATPLLTSVSVAAPTWSATTD